MKNKTNMLFFSSFFETQEIQQNERPDHWQSVRDEPRFIEGQPLHVHRRSWMPMIPIHHIEPQSPSLSLY